MVLIVCLSKKNNYLRVSVIHGKYLIQSSEILLYKAKLVYVVFCQFL